MISQKFSATSEDQITSFMNENESQIEEESLLDSIESVSDLWVLAKMKESFNEDNDDIHNCFIDNAHDEFSPLRGENSSGCSHWLG